MMELKSYKPIASIWIVVSIVLVLGVIASIYSERRISEIHAAAEYRSDILKDLPNAFVMGVTVGPFAFFTPKDSDSTPGLHERAILFRVGFWGWAGLCLVAYFLTRGGYYRNCGISFGVASLIFSMSDAVEMLSGSWKFPIWSLAIRCLDILFVVLLCIYCLKLKDLIRSAKTAKGAGFEP